MQKCNETALVKFEVINGAQDAFEVKKSIEEAIEYSDSIILDIQKPETMHLIYVRLICAAFNKAHALDKEIALKGVTDKLFGYINKIGIRAAQCKSFTVGCNCPWS